MTSEKVVTSQTCEDIKKEPPQATAVDTNWEAMLKYAKIQQQEYYELLAEWTKYRKDQYKYLKQNIGFALFGPPSDIKEANTQLDKQCKTDDIIDQFHYKPQAQKIIDSIYQQVCKFGEGQVDKECIYFGIIFNITFRTKKKSIKASKSTKNDVQGTSKESETKSTEKEKQTASKENEIELQPMPIFKIRRIISPKEKNYVMYARYYGEWYIDACGRVYETWESYKKNNTLPQCTMVIPKDGFYQPDPSYEITEEYSTVWLEILESPQCTVASNILNGIDTTSNVLGAVSLGLGIASMFTPAAPIVIGTVVTAAVSGVWTAGRSVHHLIDKNVHKESISLTDKDALCSWLAISGSIVGLAASGGSILITRAAQNGKNISQFVQFAYNTILLSNLGINGCGVGFRAYCMYKKYQDGQKISTIDVLSVGTHILFFGNAALNFKFAGELIESTQGRILDDYRSTLRSKRLRKAFNRTVRAAAENNSNKISENAEVIRYINRKIDLQLNSNAQSNLAAPKTIVSFQGGRITINGITLLDPMKFVRILHTLDKQSAEYRAPSTHEDSAAEETLCRLKNLLTSLLTDVFIKADGKHKHVPDINEFDEICQDLKYMKDATSILLLIFQIAIAILERVYGPDFIDKAVHFVWSYVRESLRQACLNISSFITDSKVHKRFTTTIVALFEHMDEVVDELLPAFNRYIKTI